MGWLRCERRGREKSRRRQFARVLAALWWALVQLELLFGCGQLQLPLVRTSSQQLDRQCGRLQLQWE